MESPSALVAEKNQHTKRLEALKTQPPDALIRQQIVILVDLINILQHRIDQFEPVGVQDGG